MKKVYSTLLAIICVALLNAQTSIYTCDFSSGSAGWTFDNNANLDGWTVDADYSCPTPNRSGGNYLHIYDASGLFGTSCATYGIDGSAADVNADMTTNINTTGYASVTVSFWWLCVGGSGLPGLDSYGSVWYSANGGSTWTQFTSPHNEYNNQNSWVQTTISSTTYPALLNQTQLRLRFHWHNSGLGSNPSFSIDDIAVTGTGGSCTNVGGTANPNPSSVCTNQTSVIGVTSSTGTIQWQQSANGTTGWANVTGGSGATTTSYTTPALSTTTYYRAVLSQASCPDQNSSVTSVTVNPSVTPTISVHTQSNTICSGDTAFFTTTITNGGNAPVYQWKVNNSIVSVSANYSSSTLSDNSIVKCILTSNAACANPTVAFDSLVIKVNPSVTPLLDIIFTPQNPCAGDTLFFTTIPGNGGAAPTYQWKVNNNNVGTGPAYSSSTLVNGSVVTCVMTSNVACATTQQATSNPVSVFALPSVIPTISIHADSSTICQGTTVVFTSSITNQGTTPVYQWRVNGINSGTDSIFSSPDFGDNDTVICILTSNATCSNPKTVISQPVVMTVYPAALSTIATIGPTTVCEGDSVEILDAIDYTYLWNTGDTTEIIYAKTTGDYFVFLTNQFGCSIYSPTLYITVNSRPGTPIVTQVADTFTSTSATTYQWYFNDSAIDGATNQMYLATKEGYYSVAISDSNGCTNTSVKTYFLITGVGKLIDDYASICPNPLSAGNWQIVVNENMIGSNMEIMDANGRVVLQSEIRNLKSEISLNVQAGIYFLSIHTPWININRKLIKL